MICEKCGATIIEESWRSVVCEGKVLMACGNCIKKTGCRGLGIIISKGSPYGEYVICNKSERCSLYLNNDVSFRESRDANTFNGGRCRQFKPIGGKK